MAEDLVIGVAIPDLSEYVALDGCWSIGDPRRQIEAAFDGWRRVGRLPVHGRDVRLAFRTFRSNQPGEKERAGRALVEEEGAFAVLGGRDFTEGALVSAASGVPTIDVNAVPTSTLEAAGPALFTLRTAQDVLYRSFVRWAHREGLLAGRVIGVFSDRLTRVATRAALDELARLGSPPTTVLDSEGAGVGSEQDEAAPARFRADGVDLLLGFVGGSSWIATLRAAAAQGFRPALVDLETGEHTNDVTARFLPAELYDETLALTMSRVGEVAAGWPLAAETERALSDYERFTGSPVIPEAPVTSGEWSNLLISADLVALLVEGLEQAGPDPGPAALIAALETISARPTASGADVTFRPGEHWGFRGLRTVRWDARRGAWVALSGFEPLLAGSPIQDTL